MNLSRVSVAALLLLASAGLVQADQGRVIAIGDEWLLSDQAFGQNSAQTTTLADNVFGYFSNGGPSSFAVFSNNSIAYGASLAGRASTLGHTWSVNPAGGVSLSNLQNFQGVFLAGGIGTSAGEITALTQYVQGGGRVLVMAGTGAFGGAAAEANAWNPFLNSFGLGFGGQWFGLPSNNQLLEVPALPTTHPLGSSLSKVLWGYGQTAQDLDPNDPLNEVALYADFTGQPSPPDGDVARVPVIATYNVPTPGGMVLLTTAGVLVSRRRR